MSSRSCRRGLGSAGRRSCPTLPSGGCFRGGGVQGCAAPVLPFAGTVRLFRRAGSAALDRIGHGAGGLDQAEQEQRFQGVSEHGSALQDTQQVLLLGVKTHRFWFRQGPHHITAPLLGHRLGDTDIGPATVLPAVRAWRHVMHDRRTSIDDTGRLQKRQVLQPEVRFLALAMSEHPGLDDLVRLANMAGDQTWGSPVP